MKKLLLLLLVPSLVYGMDNEASSDSEDANGGQLVTFQALDGQEHKFEAPFSMALSPGQLEVIVGETKNNFPTILEDSRIIEAARLATLEARAEISNPDLEALRQTANEAPKKGEQIVPSAMLAGLAALIQAHGEQPVPLDQFVPRFTELKERVPGRGEVVVESATLEELRARPNISLEELAALRADAGRAPDDGEEVVESDELNSLVALFIQDGEDASKFTLRELRGRITHTRSVEDTKRAIESAESAQRQPAVRTWVMYTSFAGLGAALVKFAPTYMPAIMQTWAKLSNK